MGMSSDASEILLVRPSAVLLVLARQKRLCNNAAGYFFLPTSGNVLMEFTINPIPLSVDLRMYYLHFR